MCKRVLQIHKIVDGRTSYLRDKMPPNRRKLANLRCVFQDIKCRTDRFLNSFFPDAISVWNNIISNFEYLPTFGRLKSHLISLFRPKLRSTFDLHDSIYLRHLFQLRVGSSQELYLYGHSSWINLDNQKILEVTIEYIKNTNRFST